MYGLVWFLFCSCLPSTGWCVECFLISSWNAPFLFHLPDIFHLFFPSCLTCFSTGSLPLGDLGNYLGWSSFCTSTPGSSYNLFLVVISRKHFLSTIQTCLVLAHVGIAPDMSCGRGRRVDACSDDLGTSLFPQYTFQLFLHIGSIHVCVSLSPPPLFFFILLFFPFPLLRYLKYSQ